MSLRSSVNMRLPSACFARDSSRSILIARPMNDAQISRPFPALRLGRLGRNWRRGRAQQRLIDGLDQLPVYKIEHFAGLGFDGLRAEVNRRGKTCLFPNFWKGRNEIRVAPWLRIVKDRHQGQRDL